jgi:polyferredoxin
MFQANMEELNMVIVFSMFILWIMLILITTLLIKNTNLKKIYKILILVISVIIGGIILGANPNPVNPIQQILLFIHSNSIFIPMLIVFALLLLSTIVIGRMFCGYACPVGAIQELCSKINFKSNLKEQEKVKIVLKTNQKWANVIRWIFFIFIGLVSIIWGLAVLQIINPFLGYAYFTNPFAIALIIPFITLVVIVVLSIFIYRPWCRYLCPFGALASITSRFSRYKYVRTEDCTECGLCEKICPTQEAFRESSKGECYDCNRCVEICPQNAIIFDKS